MSLVQPGASTIRAGILVLCGIWGSTWLVIKEGLRDLPPLTAASARFLLAGLVLALVAPAMARREGGDRPPLRLGLAYGAFVLAGCYGIIYVVETRLPSGLVSVLWSIYPAMLATLAHVMLPTERLYGRQWAGVALGFAGVLGMLWTDVASVGPGALPLGLLLLLSPAASALGNVIIRRDARHVSSALLNRDGVLLGTLMLGACALAFEHDAAPSWSAPALASVAYLGLVGTVLAFGLYFWLLRHAPATELSVIAYVVPAISVSLGVTLGGEPLRLTTLGGMLLVLLGVALVLGRPATHRVPAPATDP